MSTEEKETERKFTHTVLHIERKMYPQIYVAHCVRK